MLKGLWLACVLAVAPAIASAQPAQPAAAPAALGAVTAVNAVGAADQRVAQLVGQRNQLNAHYQQQLATIDHLKNQKASWRHDRELNAAQADAADIATKISALDKQLATALQAQARARAAALAAIDAELAAGATGARAQQLAQQRAKLAPPRQAAKKIVIPDAAIDPLADPEELDQQAAALRDSEQQLARQVAGLESQARELADVAEAKRHHERANDLALREDDNAQRSAQHSTGAGAPAADTTAGAGGGAGAGSGAGSPGPTSGGTGGGTTTGEFGGDKGGAAGLTGTTGSFESEATIVLGDVVDHATIDSLARASRSGDPAQRAQAAKKARDAVAARLEQLRRQRALVEQRAKALRKQR